MHDQLTMHLEADSSYTTCARILQVTVMKSSGQEKGGRFGMDATKQAIPRVHDVPTRNPKTVCLQLEGQAPNDTHTLHHNRF